MTTKQQKTYEPIQDLEGEVWKPIKGYEGLYEASSMGRVKSLSYDKTGCEKLLKPLLLKNHYQGITLSKNGIIKRFLIHRLVYETFVCELPRFEFKGKGNGDEMWEINHIDENPLNNCVENLELVTHKQNMNYGTRMKRANFARKRKLYQYSLNGEFVKIWDGATDCEKEGYKIGHIGSCCKNKRNTSQGFIWSYKPLSKEECIEKGKKEIDRLKRYKVKQVYQYAFDGTLVNIWESTSECGRNGFSQTAVSRCCRNKARKHKGYIWSFTPLFNND